LYCKIDKLQEESNPILAKRERGGIKRKGAVFEFYRIVFQYQAAINIKPLINIEYQ
jgi:hypothetical protein